MALESQKLPPEMPGEFTRRAVQEIDAAMFSGDLFWRSAEAREHLEWYMARWKRALDGIKNDLAEEEAIAAFDRLREKT